MASDNLPQLLFFKRRNIHSAPSGGRRVNGSQDNRLISYKFISNQRTMSRNLSNINGYKPAATRNSSKEQNRHTTAITLGNKTENEYQSRQLKRSLSSNTSRWSGGDTDEMEQVGYYRPMTTPSKKRVRSKKRSVCYSDSDKEQRREVQESPPVHVWECFRGHISMLNGMNSMSNSSKQAYAMKASDIHNKVLKDIKEKTLRRKTKSIMLAAKLLKPCDKKPAIIEKVVEEESDSESEEEKEMAEKRKQKAQRHWAIIRREINEKIRLRKENNSAERSWNILRHQVRAATRAEAVRLELYAKYGVMKSYAKVNLVDKPVISDEAQQLISTFQSLEVKNIGHTQIDKVKQLQFS